MSNNYFAVTLPYKGSAKNNTQSLDQQCLAEQMHQLLQL